MSQFTLVQLGAFVTVARLKNYSKAAAYLRKDRKTISEQIEFLELSLGYALFQKQGRTLELTEKGEKLSHRAQLLWADVAAFERFASSLYDEDVKKLSVCFDESIPVQWLSSLNTVCGKDNISLNLIRTSREYGESLLKNGLCQLGFFLAKGQVINPELYWKTLPPITMSPFASKHSRLTCLEPCSIRQLTNRKQYVYTSVISTAENYPLLLSDDYVLVSDLALLINGLMNERGWAFLPNHLEENLPSDIAKIRLDVAEDDFSIQLQTVLLWAFPQPFFLKLALKAIEESDQY